MQISEFKKHLEKKGDKFQSTDKTLSVSYGIHGLDGRLYLFELEISFEDSKISVKEVNPKLLPSFCPNRHINFDGTFCLGYKNDPRNKTNDVDTWFKRLDLFLEAQLRIRKSKKWPADVLQLAHGEAADFQLKKEGLLYSLPASIRRGFNSGQIRFQKVKPQNLRPKKSYYHIYLDDFLIATSWLDKVHNKRNLCICENSKLKCHQSIGKCSNQCLLKLVSAFKNDELMIKAEQEFWESYKDKRCCGTLDKCELKKWMTYKSLKILSGFWKSN